MGKFFYLQLKKKKKKEHLEWIFNTDLSGIAAGASDLIIALEQPELSSFFSSEILCEFHARSENGDRPVSPEVTQMAEPKGPNKEEMYVVLNTDTSSFGPRFSKYLKELWFRESLTSWPRLFSRLLSPGGSSNWIESSHKAVCCLLRSVSVYCADMQWGTLGPATTVAPWAACFPPSLGGGKAKADGGSVAFLGTSPSWLFLPFLL